MQQFFSKKEKNQQKYDKVSIVDGKSKQKEEHMKKTTQRTRKK